MTSSNVASATNNKNLRTDIKEARDADAVASFVVFIHIQQIEHAFYILTERSSAIDKTLVPTRP